ncbi:MAG TPA: hypothetical protein VLI41_07000 [Phenylobacterium sp.]|uniref:hypothetical protein n=1 Tax=Phenylobacterium sp. TaxID=1871053 RepID=UPI002C2C6AD2|nr:hypothetical protein [Phenylobacterium sp.]HSV02939.1 hypothetical protein [Phenylobacterium sp.]
MAERQQEQPARSPSDRGPPNAKPRQRGSRWGDPKADSAEPDRDVGAGGQIDDGPGISPGGGRKHA